MKKRTLCELCGEDIAEGYMTEYKNTGHYLCAKCMIDVNRGIEQLKILQNRKKELMEQLQELEIEIELLEKKYEVEYNRMGSLIFDKNWRLLGELN